MAHCNLCNRNFGSVRSLNQHLTASASHRHRQSQQYDSGVSSTVREHDQIDGRLDHSPWKLQHFSGQSYSPSNMTTPYTGEEPAAVARTFTTAIRLRHRSPSPETIAQLTNFSLDTDVIQSVIEATTRLLPVDNTVDGITARRQRDRERAERARQAEDQFVSCFQRMGYHLITENEQKRRAIATNRVLRVTPDIIFPEAVVICGHQCLWIEYKHYFGFRKNPFVAAKEKCQVQKYASQIGPGIVVYALGFERDHLCIGNVHVMREVDIVGSFKS